MTKNKRETRVISIISGPGTGKSILASELFSALKRKSYSCELSSEYIKRKLREQATKVTQNQIYIFGKHQFQLFSLRGEVDIIITDAPLIFSTIYDDSNCPFLKGLVLKEFNSYKNMNYYINRDENAEYEQEGRYQDINGAKKIDAKVKSFMVENNIPFTELSGIGMKSLIQIVNDVDKEFGK